MRLTTIVLCLLSLSTVARAEITKQVDFEPSARTSLKVLEPAGARVTVTVDGQAKEDEVPAIFALADADAFLVLKVTMADGESWSGKVEVKARKQTVVKFTQGGKKAPAPAAAARNFTGQLINDSNADRCDKDDLRSGGENVIFVVMANGAEVWRSQLIFPGKQTVLAVEEGVTYTVNMIDASGTSQGMRQLRPTGDGWKFATGCFKVD